MSRFHQQSSSAWSDQEQCGPQTSRSKSRRIVLETSSRRIALRCNREVRFELCMGSKLRQEVVVELFWELVPIYFWVGMQKGVRCSYQATAPLIFARISQRFRFACIDVPYGTQRSPSLCRWRERKAGLHSCVRERRGMSRYSFASALIASITLRISGRTTSSRASFSISAWDVLLMSSRSTCKVNEFVYSVK